MLGSDIADASALSLNLSEMLHQVVYSNIGTEGSCGKDMGSCHLYHTHSSLAFFQVLVVALQWSLFVTAVLTVLNPSCMCSCLLFHLFTFTNNALNLVIIFISIDDPLCMLYNTFFSSFFDR